MRILLLALFLITTVIPAAAAPETTVAADEVGSLEWGFKVKIPDGWTIAQRTPRLVLLARPGKRGAIVLLPHAMQTLEQVTAKMVRGLSEENVCLNPTGTPRKVSATLVVGDYAGTYDTLTVNSHWATTLAPRGGGVMILASAAPEFYTPELAGMAEKVAAQLVYLDSDYAELTRFFTGNWQPVDDAGTAALVLGADGVLSGEGRWQVRGTQFEGAFIVKADDGQTRYREYRVRTDRGQIIWGDYYIDGKLYRKARQ
ncbi:MAG: hypothetical protein FJX76_19355 [Armatimonadetes bacterium]|nr:hypothetical protein [Armatimonadota bacterium]